jgi:hypothetical protein
VARKQTPERVIERRRAAALARHYREQEGLKVSEIAARLGRAPATISAYLNDPDGSKNKHSKSAYRGTCQRCGAPTWGSGPGRSRTTCARCNGRGTLQWQPDVIEAALRAWNLMYGEAASSTDLSLAHAKRAAERGNRERLQRLRTGWDRGRWPSASVVQYHYGSVANANRIALADRSADDPHP